MKFFSIKYKLLLTFAVFLVIITLCHAVLTSYVINRRGEEEAFAQLSRQLRLFQNDLEAIRETQVAVGLEAARDDKNLSDLAILYAQALKLRQESGTVLENTFSLNKAASLNRLQLIMSSARLSSATVYLEGELSHYVTQDEAGMIVRCDGRDAMVGTNQKEDGNVQLTTWRTWSETLLPVLVARHTPVVNRVTVAFEFPAPHLMVLRVIVPIQGVLRESFLETIAEHLTIAAPETLRPPQNDGQTPHVIGMFVFSKAFDSAFLQDLAAQTNMFPAMFSPDGQQRVQSVDLGSVPAELVSTWNDERIQSRTITIGRTSYYQAFMLWRIKDDPALILGVALSREGTLTTIRQTIITITGAAAVILLTAGALGYLVVARLVAPIKSLTERVSAIGLKTENGGEGTERGSALHTTLGEYLDRRITMQPDDEIGELTCAFNIMAGQLHDLIGNLETQVAIRTQELSDANQQLQEEILERKQAQQALIKARDGLEMRVQERTSELAAANEALRSDIVERKRAEEALKASEAKYMDLYENAPDMYASVNAKTALIEQCNDTLANTLGYSKEEIIGQPVFEIYHPDCLEEVKKTFKLFGETGEIHDKELQLRRKDGLKLDVSLNVSSVRDEDGHVLYSRSTLRDITERKRHDAINASRLHLIQFAITHSLDELLEETLNEAEKLTDSLIGFYHFVEDDQQTLTLQNWSTRTKAEFCRAEGKGLHYAITEAGVWVDCVYQRKPVIHNDYASLPHRKGMPEGHAEVIRELVVPVLQGEKIKAILGVGNKSSDYTEQDVETLSLLADLAWEIAERKQTEEAYRASVSRFRELFNKAAIPLCFTSEEGATLDFNVHFEKTFGYSHEEVPTINEWWQLAYPDPVYRKWVLDTCYAAIQRAVNTKSDIEPIEYRVTCKNGDIRTMVVYGSFIDDELLLTFFDITERKQAEQERLAHLRFFERLDQVNRAIQGTSDLEQVMRDVLDLMLSILECDRAFLLYPCDPDAPSWSIPMECTKPEYPGAGVLGTDIPMDPEVSEALRVVLESDSPVKFDPESKIPLPAKVAKRFGMKSFIAMSLHPVNSKPWEFGLHQCSYARVWTPEEEKLFQEISRRLGDALTSLLTYQKLQQSEERLRLTLEAAQIGIWDWDIQHDRWYASPIYYTMLGYEPKEGLADRSEWLERLHPDDRDMVYAKIQHVLARDFQEYRYEARMRHADGAYRWVSVVGSEIQRDQDGQVTRMLGIRMDITDRKQAEQELATYREHLEELVAERTTALEQEILERKHIEHALQEAKDAAEAANRAKSEFLANMSHELRTPLNAILGYAQLLKREKNLTAKQQDQLTTIHSSGEHLVTLISDLLDLSRIEAQKMEVELTTFNLPDLLRSILDASRPRAEKKSLFVRYEEVSPVPAMVKGDERKLRQVLLNLLDNAIKYTEQGGVTLRVNSQQSAITSHQSPVAANCQLPTANLLFEVEDTGIGISDEQMKAIFEPFTRVDSRPTEGIGLGLAICRRLVELMGGRLSVDSEIGKGSTFTVEVELEVVEASEVEAKAPENAVVGYQGERKCLLIVDDNITNLAMLVSVLDPLGFAIETADSGEEALQKAAATLPDLILLDLLMSGMDGHVTLQRLRRTEGLEQVKVIGVSAAVADKARVKAFAAACDAFLAKPVDIRELQEKLETLLQITWIEEEPEAAAASASVEVSSVGTDKPEKWPPQTVVNDLLDKVEWGDFTRLEKILDRLEGEDNEYKGFCDKIRASARRFDDDAIMNYLSQ